MKKVWNAPEVQELTIQATACTGWNNGGWNNGGWGNGRPGRPGRPDNGGNGGNCGGDNMSPDEFHPENGTSSF